MKKIVSFIVFGIVLFLSIAAFAQGESVLEKVEPALPYIVTVVCGLLAPLVIQLATKWKMSKNARYVLAFALSGLSGAAALWLGKFPINLGSVSILILFIKLAYNLYWKKIILESNGGSLLSKLKSEPSTS